MEKKTIEEGCKYPAIEIKKRQAMNNF